MTVILFLTCQDIPYAVLPLLLPWIGMFFSGRDRYSPQNRRLLIYIELTGRSNFNNKKAEVKGCQKEERRSALDRKKHALWLGGSGWRGITQSRHSRKGVRTEAHGQSKNKNRTERTWTLKFNSPFKKQRAVLDTSAYSTFCIEEATSWCQ